MLSRYEVMCKRKHHSACRLRCLIISNHTFKDTNVSLNDGESAMLQYTDHL